MIREVKRHQYYCSAKTPPTSLRGGDQVFNTTSRKISFPSAKMTFICFYNNTVFNKVFFVCLKPTNVGGNGTLKKSSRYSYRARIQTMGRTHSACHFYTGTCSGTALRDRKDEYATILLGISLSITYDRPLSPISQFHDCK